MSKLNKILEKIRDNSIDSSYKGMRFEDLVAYYFLHDAKYKNTIREVYHWRDFPYNADFISSKHDIGIDLVLLDVDDNWYSIQCKFYDGKTNIS